MGAPDFATRTTRVADLTPGDRVVIPMVGNIETVTANSDGLVSTSGTGPDSAYIWLPADEIDIVNSGGAA